MTHSDFLLFTSSACKGLGTRPSQADTILILADIIHSINF